MPSISDIVSSRGISEALHFTTNLGLTGCLDRGLVLPRSKLPQENRLAHILTLNAPFRSEAEDWFDKTENWIDYVNISISEITTNLFKHSLKWHREKEIYWIVLGFDPLLMCDSGVYFTTTNNIYPAVQRGQGPEGLEALFDNRIPRKPGWIAVRGTRAANLPTCEQAEILYPAGLPMRYLRTVYVREGEEADRVSAVLMQFGRSDVQVVVSAAKFFGKP